MSRSARKQRTRKPEALTTVLKRFTPPHAWPTVEFAFALALKLRTGQRENDARPDEVGLFLDICEAATRELRHIQSVTGPDASERRDDATHEP